MDRIADLPSRQIDCIIVHCADTPEDNPATPKIEGLFTAADVELWHKQRAEKEPWSHFKDAHGVDRYIGYHYVVTRTGAREKGRPEEVIGCHCAGMNRTSLGVCWIGRKALEPVQRVALVRLVAELCIVHALAPEDVFGHSQFSKKTCPNFNSDLTFETIEDFRREVDLAIRELK